MKIAVILHAYYPELRAELDRCLANLDEPYDLFVTDASTDANRGFDVWPFLRVLNGLDLSQYTHILKLHTKRDVVRPVRFNGLKVSGSMWRDWLLSIVRTSEAWAATKARIAESGVGMVAAAACILDRAATRGQKECDVYDEAVREAARRFGKEEELFRHADYVGGTMFFARSAALRPLQGLFRPDDFAVSDEAHVSNSFAHVAERLIGFSVAAAGLRIESPAGHLSSLVSRLSSCIPHPSFLKYGKIRA